MTIFSDIETFAADLETRLTGKISTATADSVKKSTALQHVASALVSKFAADPTTWASLDAQNPATIAANAASELAAVENSPTDVALEPIALKLVYLLFQTIEKTNTYVAPAPVAPTTPAPAVAPAATSPTPAAQPAA